jgi:hypothetical protein
MVMRYAVARIKGTDPQLYAFIGADLDEGDLKSGKLGLTEEEMRKYLRKLGANDQEIKAEFEKANNHPPA